MTSELASDTAALRKERGAFFTPPEVTAFLAAWAIRTASDRVLEPSCGDGAILAAAAARLGALGGPTPIRAYEVHRDTADQARGLLAALGHPGDVRVEDFLATVPEPCFTAVVGNPPYIRYQGFTGEARAAGLTAALAQGVRLSRLASSWAPFVIHSAAHLAPGGRLALVLPAELTSANYAQEVRDFLLARFATVQVVFIDRQVFPGVQTEALLLLAEGSGGTDRVRFAVARDASDLDAARFDFVLRAASGDRWTSALVPDDASSHLTSLTAGGVLSPLSTWGRLSLGAVTGNNAFFTMSPAAAHDLGLLRSDVVAISPPGSAHLRALSFSKADHRTWGQKGARTLLFRPEEPSPAARVYIAHGEQEKVHEAYKCRVRAPWWRTPLPAAPDLFFTYMNEGTPQLALNPGGLHALNSVHGLYLHDDHSKNADVLPLAALNTATALSAEVTGRSYGGGVLKLEPREATRLLVPSAEAVDLHAAAFRAVQSTMRRRLRAGRLDEVRQAVDAILFGDAESDTLGAMRQAHATLSQRRRTRAASHTRTRGAR